MKKLTIQVLILAGTVLFLGSNYTLGQTDNSSGGASASATGSAKKSQSWFGAGDTNTLGQTDNSSGGASASATGSTKKSQSWFDAGDTNKDGKISHEEYMEYTKSRFQSADANGDGFLTKDEVEKGKRRGKGKKTKKGGSFGAN